MPVMSKLVGAAALLAFTATNAHATTYFKDDFASTFTKGDREGKERKGKGVCDLIN